MRGMRVKLTFTFSAVGTSAPLFVSVVGLTERELPEDMCIPMRIEGLCVGGGGVNVGWKGDGWLVLMRGGSENNDAPDKQRYKYYRDNVLLPFISQSRKEFDGFDDESGISIPTNLTAVSWCDGDLAQIASVIEDVTLFHDKKVTANKQSAARSGVEQAADLSKCFKIVNNIQSEYTVSDLPAKLHPLKRSILTEFNNLARQGRINLAPNKKNALVDFYPTAP